MQNWHWHLPDPVGRRLDIHRYRRVRCPGQGGMRKVLTSMVAFIRRKQTPVVCDADCRRGYSPRAGDSHCHSTLARPASPVVGIGDTCLKGQSIAEAAGFVSVPMHAPTSGTISAIEERLIAHPSGHSAPCIVIATDGKDEWSATTRQAAPTNRLDKSELLELIRTRRYRGYGRRRVPHCGQAFGESRHHHRHPDYQRHRVRALHHRDDVS